MKVWDPTKKNESQLWVMAAIAFAVVYSNYMMPPLIPALSREFSVSPYQLGWLIPGFLIPYGISTLVYGALSDRWGRTPVLVTLLCFATATMVMVSLRRIVADTDHRADSIGRGMWRNRHHLSGGCRGPLSL